MTPLRKKMIRELELQRNAPSTIANYVRSVAELAKFHGKSPELLDVEEVRDPIVIAVRFTLVGDSVHVEVQAFFGLDVALIRDVVVVAIFADPTLRDVALVRDTVRIAIQARLIRQVTVIRDAVGIAVQAGPVFDLAFIRNAVFL